MKRSAARLVLFVSLSLLLGLLLVVASTPVNADDWRVSGMWNTIANGDDVRAIARDGDKLWTATEGGGVVRWSTDGLELDQYLAPQDGLPCNDVADVVSWRGQWWFGTCDGLAVYDVAEDKMKPVIVKLPSQSVTALTVDGSDRLWVATEPIWDPDAVLEGTDERGGWVGGGVAVGDGGTWRAFTADDGVPSDNVLDVEALGTHIWVATEPYQRWAPPGQQPDGGSSEGRWETTGGGVGLFDGSIWQTFNGSNTTALSDSARKMAVSGNTLWIGTGGRGLVAYRDGVWASLTDCGDARRCIQDNYITALAASGDGAVWVGTSRFNGRGTGVNVLDSAGTPTDPDDDAWLTIGGADGLPAETIHAITPDATDASVWFGVGHMDPSGRTHGRGMSHLLSDRQTMTTFTSADVGSGTLVGNEITALARDPVTGDMWVGTDGSGVSVHHDNGTWSTFTVESTFGKLGSDSIADIVVEPSGVVWIAARQTEFDTKMGRWSDGGLSRVEGTTWTVSKAADSGLPSDHLSVLALDGRGKLWVGTGATTRGPKEHAFRGWGLAVVDLATGQWERTFTVPELTSNNITDLHVYGGALWVATSYFHYVDDRPGGAQISTGGGVSVYNLERGTWNRITEVQGLTPSLYAGGQTKPLLDMRSIAVDPAGGVWVGSMSFPKARFEPGVVPDGVVDHIGTSEVTSHRFPGAGAVVALDRDPSGFVWAGSEGGGLHIWVGDSWIVRSRQRGGLPSSDLTEFSFDAADIWLGTAGHGLIHLVDPETNGSIHPTPAQGTRDPDEPTPTPIPVVTHLPEKIFLPAIARGEPIHEAVADTPDRNVSFRVSRE